jgi:L-lactate dehydrogenase complex protein LldE
VLHIKEHLHGGAHEAGVTYEAAGAADAGRADVTGHVSGDAAGHAAAAIRSKIFELVEFLTDVLKVQQLDAEFPHKVGLHQSCHGQRGLKLAQMSELMAPPFSKPEQLLKLVKGIELVELDRKDECCGFGGTFCVAEEAVSVKMGKDRVADHLHHGAEYITAADMSCLMHLEGILRRQKSPVQVRHIAEILNGRG